MYCLALGALKMRAHSKQSRSGMARCKQGVVGDFITGSLKHLGSERWCGARGRRGGGDPLSSDKFFKQVPPFFSYCLQLALLAVTVTLRKSRAAGQGSEWKCSEGDSPLVVKCSLNVEIF